jgi:hypothetical protein
VDLPSASEQAYQAYLSALEHALADPGLYERAATAHEDYMRVVLDVWTADAQERAGRAFADYGRVLQEGLLSPGARRSAEEAFRDYVRSVKQAWADVDPDTVDLVSLSTMAQRMTEVVWMLSLGLQDPTEASSSWPQGTRVVV